MIHNHIGAIIKTKTNTNNFKIMKDYEVLFGFDIDSSVNTLCQIYIDDKVLFSFDIIIGCKFYPCFLLCIALPYSSIFAKFSDNVISVKYIGRVPDMNTLRLFCQNTCIVNHNNGMKTKYNMNDRSVCVL